VRGAVMAAPKAAIAPEPPGNPFIQFPVPLHAAFASTPHVGSFRIGAGLPASTHAEYHRLATIWLAS
jgi:hypothetical protein